MQPAVFQQFSSPTNSTIDESPVTSFVQQPMSPINERDRHSPYPEEKIAPPRVDSPYNFAPPRELHPAHFAPYAETSPTKPPTSGSYQLSNLPPKPESSGSSQLKAPYDPPVSSTPLLSKSDIHHKQDSHPYAMPPRAPTYNPNSLTGPNDPTESHRPGQVSHPNSQLHPEWKHGMCELDTLCCLGLVCPCMVYGKTQYRLMQKAQRREPTDLLGYNSWNGSCGLMAVACGVQCSYFGQMGGNSSLTHFTGILAAIQQTRIRKIYHLNGSIGNDCIKSLCCCCCVLMQNEREVRRREELLRRHAGPASAAYIPPGTMVYAPPPR